MLSGPFGKVAVLPVAIPLGLVVFIVLLLVLRKRASLTWPRVLVAAAVAVYTAGIFANTVFPIYLFPARSEEPYVPHLALIPFYDYEVEDAVTNIAVFLPLGILIPLLQRRPTWWKILATAAGVSAGIELAQLAADDFFNGGHIADVNDFMWNVTGGLLGYLLFRLISRAPTLSPLVNRFRWHDVIRERAPLPSS